MKLYHCTSARSLRVLWTLAEMGLDHELVTMEFPPRYTYAGYKAINPLGTVPTFIDGDVVMTESAGICQYLVDRYGPTSIGVRPEEPAYGDYLNWLHRSDATLTFPLTLVFRYAELEPEERRNPQVVTDYRKWFLARARSLDARTGEAQYLCADRFTIADICVGYTVGFALRLGVEEILTDNIRPWWERITSRPTYARASV